MVSDLDRVRQMVWSNIKLAVGGLDRDKALDILKREFNLNSEKEIATLKKDELIDVYSRTDAYVNYKMV